MQLQKKAGVEHPVSLLPSKIKDAWNKSRERGDRRFYDSMGAEGSWEDKFNILRSRGKDKTNKAFLQEEGYVADTKKEIDISPIHLKSGSGKKTGLIFPV